MNWEKYRNLVLVRTGHTCRIFTVVRDYDTASSSLKMVVRIKAAPAF